MSGRFSTCVCSMRPETRPWAVSTSGASARTITSSAADPISSVAFSVLVSAARTCTCSCTSVWNRSSVNRTVYSGRREGWKPVVSGSGGLHRLRGAGLLVEDGDGRRPAESRRSIGDGAFDGAGKLRRTRATARAPASARACLRQPMPFDSSWCLSPKVCESRNECGVVSAGDAARQRRIVSGKNRERHLFERKPVRLDAARVRLYESNCRRVRPGIVLPRTACWRQAVGVARKRVLYIIYKMRSVNLKLQACSCVFRARWARGLHGSPSPGCGAVRSSSSRRWPPPIGLALVCVSDGRVRRSGARCIPGNGSHHADGATGHDHRDRPATDRSGFPRRRRVGGAHRRPRLGRRRPEEVHPRSHRQRRGHFRRGRRRADGRVPRQRHDARRWRRRRSDRRAGSIETSAISGSRTSPSRAGLRHVGWAQGVCAGDYDNDGATDLFVTYYGQSTLYRNHGRGGSVT